MMVYSHEVLFGHYFTENCFFHPLTEDYTLKDTAKKDIVQYLWDP